MSRVIADGLSAKGKAEVFHPGNVPTTAENQAGVRNDLPATPKGVHEAFNQYGLGLSDIADYNGDLNTLIASGMYLASADALNKPDGAAYKILVLTNFNIFVTQVAWRQVTSSADQNMYIRESYNDGSNGRAWKPWRRLFHTGNILGTVSQTSGVPTGAIIERGSNANGEYVKFADGTMDCWRNLTVNGNDSADQGSLTFNFPVTFSAVPVCVATASVSGTTSIKVDRYRVGQAATNGVTIHFIFDSVVASTQEIVYALHVKGRWF